MNKRVFTVIGVCTLSAMLLAGCGSSSSKSDEITESMKTAAGSMTETTEEITLAEAKSIALDECGVQESDARNMSAELVDDDGSEYYAVEFDTETSEYELEIQLDGEITKQNVSDLYEASAESTSDTEDKTGEKTSDKTSSKKTSTDSISEKKATNIALKDAGIKRSATDFINCQQDMDDSILQYEIEFVSDGIEYDYEINAQTGDILSKDSEYYELDD